jgi:cation transport regulator ChaC
MAALGERSEYVFAYGSLIWRPGFKFDHAIKARASGYERNFCQASHDHRGTPDKPGRVVTLVPAKGGDCWGLAYRLPDENRACTLQALDEREKDGYQRCVLTVTDESGNAFQALTWVATKDNPSWRGGESFSSRVRLIADRSGPSGSNAEYLFKLRDALRQQNIVDSYIERLADAVQNHS